MYEFIEGHLISKSPGEMVLHAGGVGYLFYVPVSTYETLKEETTARLYTHLYVRDDCLRLYGFSSLEEREIFRQLHSVGSVGPEKALNILSALKLHEIRRAVSEGDLAALTSVKGVGRKIAERIILELRDELAPTAGPEEGPLREEIAQAEAGMISLGYRKSAARRAVQEAAKQLGEKAPVEVLIRKALQQV